MMALEAKTPSLLGAGRVEGVVVEPTVRVREAPSIETPIVGRLEEGQRIQIMQQHEGWGDERGWYWG